MVNLAYQQMFIRTFQHHFIHTNKKNRKKLKKVLAIYFFILYKAICIAWGCSSVGQNAALSRQRSRVRASSLPPITQKGRFYSGLFCVLENNMSRTSDRMSRAGGTKTTSKCCFWTTGEGCLMSRNGSNGEFSRQVPDASASAARRASSLPPVRLKVVRNGGFFCVQINYTSSIHIFPLIFQSKNLF